MGRPRKQAKEYEVTGADPVLRDDEGFSPADHPTDALTEEAIRIILKPYIEAGVKLRVTDKHWFMAYGKLSNSGSLKIPEKPLKAAADFLIAQQRYVESVIGSAKRAKKLGLGDEYSGLGQVIGKDDLNIQEIA